VREQWKNEVLTKLKKLLKRIRTIRRTLKRRRRKGRGIESIVEPGFGALYFRMPWMKKLDDMEKEKRGHKSRKKVQRRE